MMHSIAVIAGAILGFQNGGQYVGAIIWNGGHVPGTF